MMLLIEKNDTIPRRRSRSEITTEDCHAAVRSIGWIDIFYGDDDDDERLRDVTTTVTTILPESFFSRMNTWFCLNNDSSSSSSRHSPLETHRKRHVQFADQIQVRVHETILGYHPSCQDGLALTCGWAYAETAYLPLPTASSPKKSMRDMRLNQMTRRQRLRENTGLSNLQLLQLANELLDHVRMVVDRGDDSCRQERE